MSATDPNGLPQLSKNKPRPGLRYKPIEDQKILALLDLPDGSDDDFVSDIDEIDEDHQMPKRAANSSISVHDSASDSDWSDGDELPLASLQLQPKKKQLPVWSTKDNDLANSTPTFLGQRKVNVHGELPVDYFMHLFPQELLENIAYQSNLYAVQNGKENLSLTVGELKIFLGICLIMTYIRYARIRQYWSTEDGLRLDVVANNMSNSRFEEIRRFLHFQDSTQIRDDNKDKYIRVRPIVDALHSSFHAAMDAEEHIAIDEMMIPFKGRSSVKQYIPSKPKKWGYKVWVAAGVSGYVYCFELYQGAAGGRDKPSAEYGMAGDVVLRLCHDFHGKNHKIFCDNLFTSIPLALQLQSCKMWFLGTCRKNRLQGAEVKLASQKELEKMGRGNHSMVTSKENVTVVRWLDNSLVHTVSTYAGVEPLGATKRFCRKEKVAINIKRPFAIERYNLHMGGVDLMDSMVARYRNDIRNKRWYLRIFYHFLNVAVVNAWILWKSDDKETNLDLLAFKSRVATALIYRGSVEAGSRKRGRPSGDAAPPPLKKRTATKTVTAELRLDGGQHFPLKTDAKNALRCRDSRCKSKTRYSCNRCKVPLCPDCFRFFHTS